VLRGLGVRVPSPAQHLSKTLSNKRRGFYFLNFLIKKEMATVVREQLGNLHEKLVVTVNKEDYLPNFEKSLKQYSKQANIPGFRKGMVPSGLVKKMYGEGIFQEEVLKTVDKELANYIEQEKIEFFAQPIPLDKDLPSLKMSEPESISLSFELGLRPNFKVADLATGSFTKYKINVTDDMLQKEIASMQQRASNLEDADVVEADGNLKVNLASNESEAPKEISLPVTYFKEGFRAGVLGKKKEDTISFGLEEAFETVEQNYIKKELGIEKTDEAAAALSFTATITEIKKPVPAALDEKFFETMYPGKSITTLESFKEELTKDFEAFYEGKAKGQIADQIFNFWIEKTEMDLPENFLKSWMQNGQEKPVSAEEAEKEFPNFSKSLKWTLLSNQIAKENDIVVNNDDLKQYAINQLFSYYGGAGLDTEADWVQDFANKMMQDKKFVNDSAERILQNKVFDWAESKISTKEESISLEEFEALQKKN
jgi:trigger factor